VRSFRVTLITLILVSSCQSATKKSGDFNELDFASAKASNVKGLSIPGADVVIRENSSIKIIRSRAPSKQDDFQQLSNIGITDVVIFKNQISHEVDDEIQNLQNVGIQSIKHIPFKYKEFSSPFQEPCQQTVEALHFIATAKTDTNRKILFHCTVGEDRTGYLAGLVRILEENGNIQDIFKEELCGKGYSSGNPHKPRKVTAAIDRDLTPVFAKMVFLIKTGRLSWSKLKSRNILASSVCSDDPSSFQHYDASYENASVATCSP
jgi:protein-tyrosine phosphatase